VYGLHLKWQTAHSLHREDEAEENEQESAMPPNLKFCPATPSPSSALPRTLPVTTTRTRPAMDRLTRDYTDPLLTDQPDTSRQSAAVQPRRPFSPLVKRRRHRRRRLLPRPLHHSEHAR